VRDAKAFYGTFTMMVTAAAGIVLIPGAPLGLITTSVQALAGVLLPSASVFLLLLCNDRDVLGPWANKTWLNIIAAIIVSVLIELSLILVATTMFPSIDAAKMFLYMSIGLLAALLAAAFYVRTHRPRAIDDPFAAMSEEQRRAWTMPPLALLERPAWSPGRRAGMLVLRGYLVVAVVLLVVKTVQLGH
jgi:hypothetical protein